MVRFLAHLEAHQVQKSDLVSSAVCMSCFECLLVGFLFCLLCCIKHMYGKHSVKFYQLTVVFESVTRV